MRLRAGEIHTTITQGTQGSLKRKLTSLEKSFTPSSGLVFGCGLDPRTSQPFWTVNGQIVAVLNEESESLPYFDSSDIENPDMFVFFDL